MLVQAGHAVTGMTRSADKAGAIRRAGADAVVADALDAAAVARAVFEARPEVIIHQLTALPQAIDVRKFAEQFAMTNRLRTEGTDNLLAAAHQTGVRRFIAQSYAGWQYARTGSAVKTENDPLDPNPPAAFRATLAAIQHVESATLNAQGIEGLVLRYGGFYGPGNAIGAGGPVIEQVRKRQFPILGGGGGVWSFIHIDDAARATAAAVEHGAPGIYNIVDDEPATVAEWLTGLAHSVGAKPPRHLPGWLGRLLIGEAGMIMMTEVRGASNQKAKRELGWEPQWKTWRDGFKNGLSDRNAAPSLIPQATVHS